MIVCDELGFKFIDGLGPVYIVGPKQIISIDQNADVEEKLRHTEIIWMGSDGSDYRIHGYPYPGTVKDFLKLLETYHGINTGSAFALIGFIYLSLHRRDFFSSLFNLPTFIIAGNMSTGKSSLVNQISSILPHEVVDNQFR